MPKKPKPFELIPLDDLKKVVAGLVAVPKDEAKSEASPYKGAASKRASRRP
ncbi:MAG: hypothetical protein ACLPYS_00990 [Vulcanimicrobiaceae bacterium]|jgi:hypothetical protein